MPFKATIPDGVLLACRRLAERAQGGVWMEYAKAA
jgi:hypothetical protein